MKVTGRICDGRTRKGILVLKVATALLEHPVSRLDFVPDAWAHDRCREHLENVGDRR